jgi:hypothetical protein
MTEYKHVCKHTITICANYVIVFVSLAEIIEYVILVSIY